MIWFACPQCGKKNRQPDEAAGSLIFCTCGQANRVPWESTLSDAERDDEPRASRRPRWEENDERDDERPRGRGRRRITRETDPRYCLNHDDRSSAARCVDCQEGFAGKMRD